VGSNPLIAGLCQAAALKLKMLAGTLALVLLSPGSSFSILSLLSALGLSVGYVVIRRHRRGRAAGPKLLIRALLPRRRLFSPSGRADIGFFLLNTFALGGLIGWGLISHEAVRTWTHAQIAHRVGAHGLFSPPGPIGSIAVTVALFLAYELAYWVDHYLSHKVPFLWAFHRVHHTAEGLSPLTVFRVHPVETLKFANIVAVFTGVVGGLMEGLFGAGAHEFGVSGSNLILLGFVFVTVHLQHSHIWISFPGVWGRIFASPAHHQVHHSRNPDDFGKNLGSTLMIWDGLFGTLRLPAARPERLTFGVDGAAAPHTVTGGLITPFVEALRTLPGARPLPAPALPDRVAP
jgi:sterol desaturase/sphingolipid hydroxylase (fatty acid hydroxylase superfamily)